MKFFSIFSALCLISSIALTQEHQEFCSQFKQDQYLYETLFKDKYHGVFVDVGAHDGKTFSNTYFFEKELNWTGLCIEPIPEVFARLQNCRNATCIQGCISRVEGEASFLRIKGYSEMLSGLLNKYDPGHMARVNREIQTFKQESEVLTVKCYELNKLLLENNIRHVDLLSLDTEGGELEILQSIDFELIDIHVIDVENNAGTDEFYKFLLSKGYSLMTKLGCDEIYIKN